MSKNQRDLAMALNTFDLRLESITDMTPQVKQFAFSRVDGEKLTFIPGQFINLYFPGTEKRQQRSYSIASIPGNTDLVEIAIAYVEGGLASETLWKMQPGDVLPAAGPVGRLVLKAEEQPKRYILVGTGTGIAPYRSMLPDLKHRLATDANLQVEILFGIRNEMDLFYAEDFRAFAASSKQAGFHVCYSRSAPENTAVDEYNHRVTKQLNHLHPNPLEDIVYLCGNPAMIDDAFALLQEKGFDHKNVRREKYVFSHG
jgi:ferredoxin-NADP reductase